MVVLLSGQGMYVEDFSWGLGSQANVEQHWVGQMRTHRYKEAMVLAQFQVGFCSSGVVDQTEKQKENRGTRDENMR